MACPPKTSESSLSTISTTQNDHLTKRDRDSKNDCRYSKSRFITENTEQCNGNVQADGELAFCNNISQNGKMSKCIDGDEDICVHHSCRHTVAVSKHLEKINGLTHIDTEYNSCDKQHVGNVINTTNEETVVAEDKNCENLSRVLSTVCRCTERDSGVSCDDVVIEKEGSSEAYCSSEENGDVGALESKLEKISLHHQSFDEHLSTSSDVICGVTYVVYESEKQMPDIMRLITKDLSEPYSIYTYRYFIHNWPKLCFLAKADDKCVGAIVCKLDVHKKMVRRGYIAMLAVDSEYRRRKIGSTLVTKAIEAMIRSDCDEVVLETEITNQAALCLYENLGFVRDKRLFRYYLNGVDALRLKLWLR